MSLRNDESAQTRVEVLERELAAQRDRIAVQARELEQERGRRRELEAQLSVPPFQTAEGSNKVISKARRRRGMAVFLWTVTLLLVFLMIWLPHVLSQGRW